MTGLINPIFKKGEIVKLKPGKTAPNVVQGEELLVLEPHDGHNLQGCCVYVSASNKYRITIDETSLERV